MIKTAATIVACAAMFGFISPVQGQVASIATGVSAVSMCDGEKKKDKKEVEKPSESAGLLTMCDGDKKKDKETQKPAE